MKFKKMMLGAFLLLAILTIGSVSAFEDAVISDDSLELSQGMVDALTVEDSQDDLAENQAEEIIADDVIDVENDDLADDKSVEVD
ncbi:hypothetical protein [Methanobrevibacter sp.]